jgi:BirA family biotin operon repressor/biotin-[acetyl-CoA-carboxylase] ligase
MARKRLLEVLRRQDGEWIAWDRLAGHASVSIESLKPAVESLARDGYRVECDPVSGCRLLGCDDRLIADEIARGLGTTLVGRRITVLESTTSTNDVAWENALAEAEDGTTVLAEEQTAGRGRMGRSWVAPRRSSVLMSVLLRPEIDVRESHLVTVMAAVAVAQAIREHAGLHARIRWPNDITVKERKLAGILVEGRSLAAGSAFVVGIGLNVNTPPEQFPAALREIATSLSAEAGAPVSRIEAAKWVLKAMDRWYRDLRFGDYGRIARSWRRFSSTMGERVVLLENGREYRGRVLDLSLEEGLIVRLDEGVTRIFHPSTVSLRHSIPRHEGEGLHPDAGSVQ